MRIMPAFNIMYNELDNAGIESINAFQYDTGIDPTNTIRHNATLVLYQDAETSHMDISKNFGFDNMGIEHPPYRK